eukprot:PITA_32826
MLHNQDLPKYLWGEATKTTIYIQNRCPHKSLDNKTLEEVFTGKKPSVDHLRIFGCPVYIHIPKEKRKKLDPSDFGDEELPIFEEEVNKEGEGSHHEEEGPSEPVQPMVIQETRKRPNWLKSTLLDAEGHGEAQGSFRESKRPKKCYGYAAYMTKLIQAKPSTFEEVVEHREWKDALNEEYQSIMKNGVWEIVPRPEDKYVVTSK